MYGSIGNNGDEMCASVCAREEGGVVQHRRLPPSHIPIQYIQKKRRLISHADNVAQAAPDQLLIVIVFILRS